MAKKFTLSANQSSIPSLQLTGYYFNTSGQTTFPFFKRALFFENGTVFYDEALTTAAEFEEKIQDLDFMSSKRNDITKWGIFTVEKNNIEIEVRMADYYAPIIKFSGIILSDTSFRLQRAKTKKMSYTIDYVLKFKQLSAKPDSTNNFIK